MTQITVDVDAGSGCFLVAGAIDAGKSTTLEVIVRGVLARQPDRRVVLVTPRAWRRRPVPDGVESVGLDGAAAVEDALRMPGALVVVDDGELALEGDLAAALGRAVVAARDGDAAIVAAGAIEALLSAYRGWAVDIRSGRSGVLLSPPSAQAGDLLGVPLPRSVASSSPIRGRGIHVRRGVGQPVQVALPS